MEKEIRYFVESNGLYFSFDYAERNAHDLNRLCFKFQGRYVCQLDLSVSSLVFSHKSVDTYCFDIVSVKGCVYEDK